MNTFYKVRYASSPKEVKKMNTKQLRKNFLIKNIMNRNVIKWIYSHYDRYLTGGVVPVKEVFLETIDPLKADYFLERRELGIINVGQTGVVIVDGKEYNLAYKEALYVGRGTKEVIFASKNSKDPARFYLNATPAHKEYPTKKVSQSDAEIVELGALETSNARTIRKLIVNSIVKTCQLQMGMTELKTGSIWNTMPAHSHDRRMEVYFYFEVPKDQGVCHFMGKPKETRHIWLSNEQAVISPPWSIHAGAGTSNYVFIWGMAGENLDYGDMDHCKITELR